MDRLEVQQARKKAEQNVFDGAEADTYPELSSPGNICFRLLGAL